MREELMKNPQLDGESFFYPGNEVGVLLIHGFTATTTEMRLLADCLRLRGYTISAPLLPGHGTTPDDLNKQRWMHWYEAVEAAYLKLRETCATIFVGGESMGALLALLIASRYEKVNGVLLFAPALEVKGLRAAYVLRWFKKFQAKKPSSDTMPWKGYTVYPLRAAVELCRLQKVVTRELRNVSQPTLIFIGLKDQTITPDSGQRIMDGIASTEKELVSLKDSPHVLLLADELPQVCTQTQVFIQAHTARAA